MSTFDRYLSARLLMHFGFFALVLVAVYWVNRAIGLFDRLIADGSSLKLFLAFTALALPNVVALVLPVAALVATLYVVNRMAADSELVVAQTAGLGPWRLVRPVLAFGLVVGVMVAVLAHALVPVSRAALAQRGEALSEDVTARLLREGEFLHPAAGVTAYVREIAEDGALLGLFLQDRRDGGVSTTYTAERAYLVPAEGGGGPRLVMLDGMAQTLDALSRTLIVTTFADFAYDLGRLTGAERVRRPDPARAFHRGAARRAAGRRGADRRARVRAALRGTRPDRRATARRGAAGDGARVPHARGLLALRPLAPDRRRGARRRAARARRQRRRDPCLGGRRRALDDLPAAPARRRAGRRAPLARHARARARPAAAWARGTRGVTLALYLARRFLGMTALVTLVFVGLLLPIDLAEQMRRFGDDGASLGDGLRLAALNLPTALYEILPLVVILAALALFLALARSSEMVAVRAAGRSAMRAVLSPALSAAALGVLGLLAVNPIVAGTQQAYEREAARFGTGASSILSVGDGGGVWLRQGDAAGQTVIRAERASLDGTVLSHATFLAFDADGAPVERVDATRAELMDGAWRLAAAKRWPLAAAAANPELGATIHAALAIPSNLTRAQIRDSFGTPSAIPIFELPAFIEQLDAAGFSALTHRVWLQMELANPLMLAAMVLIGAAFTLRHARGGGMGPRVLAALLLGFGVFFLRNFARVLGESGQIPVALAVWAPPVAAVLLAVGIILQREDG